MVLIEIGLINGNFTVRAGFRESPSMHRECPVDLHLNNNNITFPLAEPHCELIFPFLFEAIANKIHL
jgi:hypothetical protein